MLLLGATYTPDNSATRQPTHHDLVLVFHFRACVLMRRFLVLGRHLCACLVDADEGKGETGSVGV